MNKRIMVDVLLKQDSYITIDKISEELAVSNKTIRNDLRSWISISEKTTSS